MRILAWAATHLLMAGTVFGFSNFTGYSSAPNRMTCASSCHGSEGGTVTVTGFPALYTPGTPYTVTVSRASGSSISNFNGSCRIGTGTENAGVISAGTLTATYSVTGESNGVHLSSDNQNSANFIWTAPAVGVGPVTLYIAALQGDYDGPNTRLVLSADEASTAVEPVARPVGLELLPAWPNPFNPSTTISWVMRTAGQAQVDLFGLDGSLVRSVWSGTVAAGRQDLRLDASGLASGTYLLRVAAGGESQVQKLLLMK